MQHIKAGATGQAAIQHLAKVRQYRKENGQAVPPEITKRRSKKANGANKNKSIDDEDDEDDMEQPFKGSKSRMIYAPVTAKAPRGRAQKAIPSIETDHAKPPRRTTKIKQEEADRHTGPDTTGRPEDDFIPEDANPPAKKKRARRTKPQAKADEASSDAMLSSRLRPAEAVNYQEPDLEEDEANGHHDQLAYDSHTAYNRGVGRAEGHHDDFQGN